MFPWWAVALLPLDEGSYEWKVRRAVQSGKSARVKSDERAYSTWLTLVRSANELAEKRPMDEWRQQAYAQRGEHVNGEYINPGPVALAVRDACLWSERAFVQFCSILDDEGEPFDMQDFHIEVVRAMRQQSPTAIFMPLEHGKSAINSILVPLMDWAEWNNATSCRVYWNQSHLVKWITRLMGHVEYNRDLQMIFPWIRRPTQDDVSRHWSTEGFSIGGRTIPDRSFEGLTARSFSTGNRYSRIGGDDWVTTGNCSSLTEQDKLFEYFLTGPMTFGQHLRRESKYGTVWGSTFYCGTFFDRRDMGYRTYHFFRNEGYHVLKYDVYPSGYKVDGVLWPQGRPAEYIEQKRRQLGTRVFNMRMRNLVIDEGMQTFPPDQVELACQEEYRFGHVPMGSTSVLAFDPASGRVGERGRNADPAIALYSEVDDPDPDPVWGQLPDLREQQTKGPRPFTSHFVRWKRLTGYDFPRQCGEIITWARYHNLAVVIESNTLQTAYKEQIAKEAPDVKVILRHTGSNSVDPENGVETFSPLFENRRVVIHTGGAPQDEVRALVEQLVEWPQARRKDVLMAFWFGRYYMRARQRQQVASKMAVRIPEYIQDHLWFWDQETAAAG